MSKFEQQLVKYMTYGFVAGLLYSFLTKRTISMPASTPGASIQIQVSMDEYVMDCLFNAALFSVLVGAFFAICYAASKWMKPQ